MIMQKKKDKLDEQYQAGLRNLITNKEVEIQTIKSGFTEKMNIYTKDIKLLEKGYTTLISKWNGLFMDKNMGETNKYCSICLVGISNYLLEPCNHLCLCEECVDTHGVDKTPSLLLLDSCPICRQRVIHVKKVFLS